MSNRLRGLIAAAHTPFHDDGRLNEQAIPAQAQALLKQGIGGVFTCGTTGEGASLSIPERMQVVEQWVASVGGQMPIIAHVGHQSMPGSCELAAHAQKCGADAFATSAPMASKPADVQSLITYCAPIAEAAPKLPFYYYHAPSVTGVHLPMPQFLDEAAQSIPNLAGIKFSNVDMMEFQQCRAIADGRYNLPFGVDESLLGALAFGAEAAIGSTYNYAGDLFHALIEAFENNDMQSARELSHAAVRMVEIIQRYGVLRSGKVLMSVWGVDCGPPRPPLQPLTLAERDALLSEWDAFVETVPVLQQRRDQLASQNAATGNDA